MAVTCALKLTSLFAEGAPKTTLNETMNHTDEITFLNRLVEDLKCIPKAGAYWLRTSGIDMDRLYQAEKVIARLERDEIDRKFIAAGHKPEDRSCDHSAWREIKQHRPRHCLTCGTCMWDAGD